MTEAIPLVSALQTPASSCAPKGVSMITQNPSHAHAENFFGAGMGAKTEGKRPGLALPAEVGVAPAGCHFRMWRWGKLASIRTLDAESGLTDGAR
jgi:hypothetical protein